MGNCGHRHSDISNEVNDILRFMHHDPIDFDGVEDHFEHLSNCYGIESRKVELTGAWYKDAVGPYLASLDDGNVVALIPSGGSYRFRDPQTGKRTSVNASSAARIVPEALMLYVPLPNRKLSIRDLFVYMAQSLSRADVARLLLAALGVVLVGMVTPAVTKVIFNGVIPAKAGDLVGAIAVLLISAALASTLMEVIRRLALEVILTRVPNSTEAAMMGRVLALPVSFFRTYSAGEVSQRLSLVKRLTKATVQAVFSSGIAGLFSLLYIVQVAHYTPQLVLPSVVVIVLQVGISTYATLRLMKREERQMRAESAMNGFMLSLINGMQKIRLTGTENLMADQWRRKYREICDLRYRLPKLLLWYGAVNTFIAAMGTVVFYAIACYGDIEYANFLAFNSAYGMLSAGVAQVLGIVTAVAEFQPMLKMLEPLLNTEPELEGDKKMPKAITGAIVLEHVSFQYEEQAQPVVNDLSLRIAPGEYVGICGSTGCGKSTLMRLMLGFETPTSGTISYDGYVLGHVNLRALRRQFGTVLQNAKLLQGSIYQNISIGNPDVTMEQAWKAAEAASIAQDIRNMPMQMETVVTFSGAGISGGQRQRILIARALVGSPKVVFMDEATSALDNIAQAQVSASMDTLGCTRIVIAHRLSTLINCDRILVLDGGKIVEDGSYEELMALDGRFAQLVAKQQL